jgi:hypothetical protein
MAAQFALMNKRTSAATIASYSYLAFWPEPLWRIVDILLDLETADHKKLINSPTLFQPLNQLHSDDDKKQMLMELIAYSRTNPGKMMSSHAFKSRIELKQAAGTVKNYMTGLIGIEASGDGDELFAEGPPSWETLCEIFPLYTSKT